jgi:hypothetical protein
MHKARSIVLLTTSLHAVLGGGAIAQEFTREQVLHDLAKASADPKYAGLDPAAKLRAYWKDTSAAKPKPAVGGRKPKTGPEVAVGADTDAVKLPQQDPQKNPTKPSPIEPFFFVLRKDYANIGIVSEPYTGGTGATISYSDDRVAKNTSLAMQSLGVLGYRFANQFASPGDNNLHLFYGILGVYGGANKVTNTNSKPTTPSADNIYDGGVLELGFERGPEYQDYFRVKVGSVTNDLATKTLYTVGKTAVTTTTSATQFSTTAEWIPVYEPLYIHRPKFDWPLGQFGVRFDPEVIAQFDDTFRSTNVLAFSGKSSAYRLGPQVGLWLQPFAALDEAMLNKLSIYTVYHWYHEFVSGRSNYVFQTNANYPLLGGGGGGGNSLALTASYQRGVDENTGKNAELFKVGLSGSLCWTVCGEKPKVGADD